MRPDLNASKRHDHDRSRRTTLLIGAALVLGQFALAAGAWNAGGGEPVRTIDVAVALPEMTR
jgi:hypothetical protein